MVTKVLWSPREDVVLRKYYGRLSYAEISRSTGRSWSAVRNRASYLGMTGSSNLGRKYSANTEFFSTPNIINSYWAGFIAADGCVSDGGRLSIGLAVVDVAHLDRLCLDLDYTGGVKMYGAGPKLTVHSKKIVRDLKDNFNITPRKSTTLKPPNINGGLAMAYICGVIDGDGSISSKPRITIYGTGLLLEWIRGHFESWTTESKYRRSKVRKIQRHLHSYKVSSRRASEVAEKLLSVDVPRLSRKWSEL